MAKELVITAQDIKDFPISEGALRAYEYLLKNIPYEGASEEDVQAFVSSRNAKIAAIRDLWELKSWFEKCAAAIKDVCKHSFNVGGSDNLPKEVKWKSGGTTKDFQDGAGAIVANALISKRLVTKDQLLNVLSVSNVCKATGLKADKLMDMFPDTIVEKDKEPSLTIV